jgi:hypothetical protein
MTLAHLRKREDLRCREVSLLVVVDGDRFENAWGLCARELRVVPMTFPHA